MQQRFLMLLLAFCCWQCKSDSEPAPGPPPVTQTKTELLTGKNWKLTAATVDPACDCFGQQHAISNIYGYMPPCYRDNLYRYELPNGFIVSDGPEVCGGPVVTGSYKWAFNSDETTITQFYSPIYADETYTIEELTKDKLVLVRKKTDSGSGTIYTFKYQYAKQ